MCGGGITETCYTPMTKRCQCLHNTGGSIQKLKMVYHQEHRYHQGAAVVLQDIHTTSCIKLTEVSARLIRYVGDVVFLLSRVYTDTVRLVGRWLSNLIMCYLGMSAQTFTEGMATPWSSMENMRSYGLPKRANTHVPRLWAYYRTSLGTGGCPGIVLVRHWRLNVYFTHHIHSILSSSSGYKPYNSQSRCSGVATVTDGTDRQTPEIWMHALQSVHRQTFQLA